MGLSLLMALSCLVRAQEETATDSNNAGLSELDKATELRVEADSMSDLERIVRFCELSLKLGLDEDNAEYAKQLMTSTLFDHAARHCGPIFDRQPRDPRWRRFRKIALNDLQRLLKLDNSIVDAHILLTKLQLLPDGDREQATKSIETVIEISGEDKEKLSQAYVLRSTLYDNIEEGMVDIDKAIEIDPDNLDALRLRGVIQLKRGNYSEAISEFSGILEKNPTDINSRRHLGEAFFGDKKYDEALENLNQAIEAAPSVFPIYMLRAKVYAETERIDEAIADLTKSIQLEPKNVRALLYRSQLRGHLEQYDLAIGDINRVLELSPLEPVAIQARASIYSQAGRFRDAISDLKQLLRRIPDSLELRLQIAENYLRDQRPRKAITLYNEILEKEAENYLALRGSADAFLKIGDQAKAMEVYEKAIEILPEDAGVVNNLAWVLATSAEESIRDGPRALELAQKACEMTEYKAAYILSTLAAAHAELGDFEAAVKWSTQAIEMAEDHLKDMIRGELETYQRNEPFRELQTAEEKSETEDASDDDLLLEP